MAYFSRLMRNTGIRVGGPHLVQRTEDVTPLEVDEFQEESAAPGVEQEEAPVISRADPFTPRIARKEAALPSNPRQAAVQSEPVREEPPQNVLPTSVMEQQRFEMPMEPSASAAEYAKRESAQTLRSPVIEEIVYAEPQSAPQEEPAIPDAPRLRPATVPAQAPEMLRPTFAEVREWVAASPQPRSEREQPRTKVSGVPVRDSRPMPEPTRRLPELHAFEQSEAVPPVAVENFTLSIGTIHVTVEEPPKPVVATVQPATRRDPPRTDESSRLSRRYIRF